MVAGLGGRLPLGHSEEQRSASYGWQRTVPSSQFWGGDGTDCVSVMLPGLAVKVTLMKLSCSRCSRSHSGRSTLLNLPAR